MVKSRVTVIELSGNEIWRDFSPEFQENDSIQTPAEIIPPGRTDASK
jgi:hypothetical protein